MATVFFRYALSSKIVPVKNLGWLLKHSHQVTEFNFYKEATERDAGILEAKGNINGIEFEYQTEFADFSICLDWLDRPVFRNLPFSLKFHAIRSPEYQELKKKYAAKFVR